MTKVLHRLAGILVFLILLFISITMFLSISHSGEWISIVTPGGLNKLTALMTAIGILCIAILYGLTGIAGKDKEKFLSFDTEGGVLSISTIAISDYISKLEGEFPAIVRMKPHVVPGRNTIDIVVNIKIKAGPDIHETCAVLQRRVRDSITTGLGIKDVRNVDIVVKEIVAETRSL
jgi:hypothetical protein